VHIVQQTKSKGSKYSGLDQEENQEKTEETRNPEHEAEIPNPEEGSQEAVALGDSVQI
jgi:hypothetical protein